MSKRLTRKQIKEDIRHDEVQTVLSSTLEYLRSHQNQVIGLGVALLVAIIGFSVFRTYTAHREEAAANELARAIKLYDAPIQEDGAQPDHPTAPSFANEEARKAKAMEALEAVDSGEPSAIAELYLAEIALREGDKATARRHWEEFLEGNENHILAVSVRLNLLRLDREEGQGGEVARELEAELEKTEKNLPEEVILYELARTLDALDRGEEAKDYYQRILDDHPQSPYSAEARKKVSGS